jgi:hypothetical protein
MPETVPFDQRKGWIWLDGQLVPWEDAKVHVLTHGLHYASSVFEGERAYSGRIYKLEEHTERLFESARILDMKIPFNEQEIGDACNQVVQAQGFEDAYVRPVVFRGSEQMSVAAPRAATRIAIAVWQWPSYFDPAQKMKGIRLTVADWKRPSPETAPYKSKAAGLYMICTLSKHKAEAEGYHDALMYDRRECVLRRRRQTRHANAGLFPRRHHTALGDGPRAGAADSRDRAAHRPRGARPLFGMLPHWYGGGSHARQRSQGAPLHPWADHRDADARLHGGRAEGGLQRQSSRQRLSAASSESRESIHSDLPSRASRFQNGARALR